MNEQLANLLGATAVLVDDLVAEQLETELGRSGGAAGALVTIANEPGLSIDRLRAALALTHSGAVRLVDRLEQDRLVRRRPRAGRKVGVELTARGRATVGRLGQARLQAVAQVLATLSLTEQRQLDALLRRILTAQTTGEDDLRRTCRLCSFEACECDGRRCPVAAAAAP